MNDDARLRAPLQDPTYVPEEIEQRPEWKLAWRMSEVHNDIAPIGWSRYIGLATWLLRTFDLTEKPRSER